MASTIFVFKDQTITIPSNKINTKKNNDTQIYKINDFLNQKTYDYTTDEYTVNILFKTCCNKCTFNIKNSKKNITIGIDKLNDNYYFDGEPLYKTKYGKLSPERDMLMSVIGEGLNILKDCEGGDILTDIFFSLGPTSYDTDDFEKDSSKNDNTSDDYNINNSSDTYSENGNSENDNSESESENDISYSN